MSGGGSNSVSITKETAKVFLPTQLRKDGSIDLAELANAARKAIEGSEKSLQAAGDIANSNVLTRLWNSGAFAINVVESIGYIRDISQVNLALSAICNDLAAANLTHAQRIDANHRETSQQLRGVQQLTGELLEHLRTARDSALLQPIVQGLGHVDASDKDALHEWLHSFSEAIDLQYLAVQDKINQLAQRPTFSTDDFQSARQKINRLSSANQDLRDHSVRIEDELKRVEEGLQNLDAEHARQMVLFGSEITHQKDLAAQRLQAFDATLRQSHEKLGNGLTQLNLRLDSLKSNLEAERKEREKQDASRLETLAQREQALRRTISALNEHWRKRLLWVGGTLLLVQLAAFAYLVVHIGGK